MPKFFKQNILSNHSSADPQTPAEIIQENTIEITPSINESHHSIASTHQYSSSTDPTEMTFPMPHDDEPLLPSPLDTPELTEHAGVTPSAEFNYEHQPNVTPESTIPHQASSVPDNDPMAIGSNGFPIPESKLVQTLLSWRAPSRPHRKKNRSFYTTVAILIILIAMISLLAGERMLVAVLFALMFLVYVLNFIEPGEIEYKISTQGVTIDEHFYHWQELDSFWFEKKDGYSVLHIPTDLKFPSMVMMVLGESTNEETVKKTVARFLPFHEIPPKSVVEKWAEGLQRYFPLENPHK